jgi:hypothetical protein
MIDHLDAFTGFPNSDVNDETQFLELLEGWPENALEIATVVRIRKAQYRLKQAPHLWYPHIYTFLQTLGFIQSEADLNLYIPNFGEMLQLLYIDQMFLAYAPTAANEAEEVTQAIGPTFKITNLSTVGQFLGVQIHSE